MFVEYKLIVHNIINGIKCDFIISPYDLSICICLQLDKRDSYLNQIQLLVFIKWDFVSANIYTSVSLYILPI